MADPRRAAAFFPVLFGLIGVLFIAILVVVFHFSQKANPVMLDDQGRPHQTHHS